MTTINRYTHLGWDVFFRVPPDHSVDYHATHEHEDFFSVSIYKDGLPQVIDPGTRSYSDPASQSAAAHNMPLFFSVPAYPSQRQRLLYADYRSQPFMVTHKRSQKILRVDIQHLGFSRILPGIIHRRTIIANPASLIIADTLSSPIPFYTSTRFMQPSNARYTLSFKRSIPSLTVNRLRINTTTFHHEYGVPSVGASVIHSCLSAGSVTNTYTLNQS